MMKATSRRGALVNKVDILRLLEVQSAKACSIREFQGQYSLSHGPEHLKHERSLIRQVAPVPQRNWWRGRVSGIRDRNYINHLRRDRNPVQSHSGR